MKPTLIIAEDIELIREELHEWLKQDFEILAKVGSGAAAIEACLRYQPDLVLMDLIMPGKSGIEATREILARSGVHPKIVMLSAVKDQNLVLKAFEAGASDYLSKPSGPKQLIDTLSALAPST